MIDEKFFALRIAKLRTKRNVSAREMSLAIGQNPNYICNIETGKSLPSVNGLFYICEYLKITPKEFFDDETENPSKVGKIAEQLKGLNDEQLEIIENLIKNMKK